MDILQHGRRVIRVVERNMIEGDPPADEGDFNGPWSILHLDGRVQQAKDTFTTRHRGLE